MIMSCMYYIIIIKIMQNIIIIIMKIYEKVNYESESVNSNFYDEFNEEDFENEKEEIHF